MTKPKRICLEPACGQLTTSTRCPGCQRRRDRQRGTRQQRGYDAEHDRLRAALLATYHPADPCARCGRPLGPVPALLDLGHTDDRAGYRGLEHRRCNRGVPRKARIL